MHKKIYNMMYMAGHEKISRDGSGTSFQIELSWMHCSNINKAERWGNRYL